MSQIRSQHFFLTTWLVCLTRVCTSATMKWSTRLSMCHPLWSPWNLKTHMHTQLVHHVWPVCCSQRFSTTMSLSTRLSMCQQLWLPWNVKMHMHTNILTDFLARRATCQINGSLGDTIISFSDFNRRHEIDINRCQSKLFDSINLRQSASCNRLRSTSIRFNRCQSTSIYRR